MQLLQSQFLFIIKDPLKISPKKSFVKAVLLLIMDFFFHTLCLFILIIKTYSQCNYIAIDLQAIELSDYNDTDLSNILTYAIRNDYYTPLPDLIDDSYSGKIYFGLKPANLSFSFA